MTSNTAPFTTEHLLDQIWNAFDRDKFARVCEMDEADFEFEYGFTRHAVDQPAPDDFFLFRAAGYNDHDQSKILAVAHLDTVARANPHERRAQFLDTEGGTVVYSRALDDRLGAYIILELLPELGYHFDVLLTVGEENGRSTAQFFDVPDAPERYNWMIEFDRGGTDVVMYQYDDAEMRDLVRECGAKPEDGIFSDISFLGHLGVKGFNWGVGYRDYHGPKSHAWLDDTFRMLTYFLRFHAANADTPLPHDSSSEDRWWARSYHRSEPTWAETLPDPNKPCPEQVDAIHEWRTLDADAPDGGYTYCIWCDAEQDSDDLDAAIAADHAAWQED